MIALGSNVHIFARPHRCEELAQCFETLLGNTVRTVEFPGIDQPMLIVSFPGGGHLSIEFTDDAPDDEQPRLGAWLELRADDPAAVLQAAIGDARRRSPQVIAELASNHLLPDHVSDAAQPAKPARTRRTERAVSTLVAAHYVCWVHTRAETTC